MPVEAIAAFISATEPVSVVTAVAVMVTVVFPSSAFRAPAATDGSVTVIVYALPVPVRPASAVISLSEISAVTTPVVSASTILASATETAPPVRDTA